MNHPFVISSWCTLRREALILNGRTERLPENNLTFAELVKALFKKEQLGYPKFYKMDSLSKLGFLCAELALRESRIAGRYPADRVAVVLSNASSSLDTDHVYQETIRDRENYFPSPSVFVYTLANIVIGEICIRHRFNGENAFFATEAFDPEQIVNQAGELLTNGRADACLCGWVEILGEHFEAALFLVEKSDAVNDCNSNRTEFTVGNLKTIYHQS